MLMLGTIDNFSVRSCLFDDEGAVLRLFTSYMRKECGIMKVLNSGCLHRA